MSKFYTPMNPSYAPQQTTLPTPVPPPQTLPTPPTLVAGNTHEAAPAHGQSFGANAALMLANLATAPGFLSERAIQQARDEYHQRQTNISSAPQGYQPAVQGYQYNQQTYSSSQPHQGSINYKRTDSSTSIEALLKELHQTEPSNSSSSSPSPSYTPSATPPAASYTSVQSSVPPRPLLAPPSPPKQPSQPPIPEDYSNGKITPQLLKKLATIAETDNQEGCTLLNEIKRLRERQMKMERSLHEDRQAMIAKHKKDLVKLQANEIMGMDVTRQLKQTKVDHGAELKQFDKHVIRALDKEIKIVQEALSKAGVPMMVSTTDPAMITSQIKVLRLLEDMLQT
ncbi:hypothetical protein BGZ65_005800 [Modicella reniformis]|uniref:Uncharacterized protein n=1 Tax=Modicella reniformis TaxID=1440133 RepID=A0A9P6MGR6_9FUNG|nr:hypothetical protein BGZ65_005800 [Modicella reniformis]